MQKKLFRNTQNKMLGGVCSGFADSLGVDTTWVRLFWALGTCFWGAGIILYILCWIIIPAGDTITVEVQDPPKKAEEDNP